MKNFALVYLVDEDPSGELMDIGNDPCFNCPPTWGICRPDIRNERELGIGSRLVFIARVYEKNLRKYYLKGYFRIKEKINIIQAFNTYKSRQNVIISVNKKEINTKWDNDQWKSIFENSNLPGIPKFLRELNWNNETYFQKASDNHGIDNWKCRRIFNCNILTFKKCIDLQECIKESKNIQLKKNYLVGDAEDFKDWNKKRIEWKEIAPLIRKSDELMKFNRHPEIELTDSEVNTIIEYMDHKS